MKVPVCKVGRIRSYEEANGFERAGADIVGFAVGRSDTFCDNRNLTLKEIKPLLEHPYDIARWVEVDEPISWLELVDIVSLCRPEFVQFGIFSNPPDWVAKKINTLGTIVIGHAIEVDFEDDPSWLDEKLLLRQSDSFVEVTLFPGLDNLKASLDAAGSEADEHYRVEDIIRMASLATVMLNVPSNYRDIGFLYEKLQGAFFGISLTLGSLSEFADFPHCVDPDACEELVRYLARLKA